MTHIIHYATVFLSILMQSSFKNFIQMLCKAFEPFFLLDNIITCNRKFELIWFRSDREKNSLHGLGWFLSCWFWHARDPNSNRHFISFDVARWCLRSRREIETFWLQTNLSHSNFVQVNYTNTIFLGLSKIKDWAAKFTIVLLYDLAKLYDHWKYTILTRYTSL